MNRTEGGSDNDTRRPIGRHWTLIALASLAFLLVVTVLGAARTDPETVVDESAPTTYKPPGWQRADEVDRLMASLADWLVDNDPQTPSLIGLDSEAVANLTTIDLKFYQPGNIYYNSLPLTDPRQAVIDPERQLRYHQPQDFDLIQLNPSLTADSKPEDFDRRRQQLLADTGLTPAGQNQDNLYIWSAARCYNLHGQRPIAADGSGFAEFAFAYADEAGQPACRQLAIDFHGTTDCEGLPHYTVSWSDSNGPIPGRTQTHDCGG